MVREIFRLYLEGNGIDTIARIMQDEGHLNCTAYWHEKGVSRGCKKTQPNPCKWKCYTIAGILSRHDAAWSSQSRLLSTALFKIT
ncbi:MAG: recombinase family protein [Clostridia bacterium]|nr:recombinase family protein [Clostridia bacterium]